MARKYPTPAERVARNARPAAERIPMHGAPAVPTPTVPSKRPERLTTRDIRALMSRDVRRNKANMSRGHRDSQGDLSAWGMSAMYFDATERDGRWSR